MQVLYVSPHVKLPPPPLSTISGQLMPGRPSGCFLCLYLLFPVLLLFPCSFFVLLFLLLCICFVFACYFPVVFGLLFDFSVALPISSASVSPSFVHCQAPPPRRAFNTPSIVRFQLARDWLLFLCIFCCLFACNKSFLDRPAFGCDAWSRPLGCRHKFYPDFRVEEDKCWPGVLNP
jgi:hypothetical protein